MSNYTENIAIRVTEEDEVKVEKYAEENGLSKSGAARKILYDGMMMNGMKPSRQRVQTRVPSVTEAVRLSVAFLLGVAAAVGWGII